MTGGGVSEAGVSSSKVDARLTALYERYGARFIVGHLVGVYTLVGLLGALGGELVARWAGVGGWRALGGIAVLELSLAVPVAWATWAMRDDIRTMMRWAAAPDSRDARAREEIIPAVFRFSPRFAVAVLWRVVLFTPGTAVIVFGLRGRNAGPLFALLLAVASLFIIMYGGLVGAFLGQLSLRPIRKEAGRSLTRAEFAPLKSLSVSTKITLGFVSGLLIIGFVIVAFALPQRGASTLERAFLSSVLIASTIGLLLAIPVTQNVLGPVYDLLAGTHRVAAGDLGGDVPVTSTDELGELAASFNEMLDGLREREQLRDELRASRARLVVAADTSRRRVEQDLHDGAQQYMTLLQIKLGMAARAVEGSPQALAIIDEARGDLDRALAELRDLAHGIYPAVLESEGLQAALADAAQRAAIPTEVQADGPERYPAELETAVYFCCLEALQNAAKHAGDGARATVRLAHVGDALAFEVRDDGRGYDPAAVEHSSGVQNMADRIGALGGTVRTESASGQGTTVIGRVPLAPLSVGAQERPTAIGSV